MVGSFYPTLFSHSTHAPFSISIEISFVSSHFLLTFCQRIQELIIERRMVLKSGIIQNDSPFVFQLYMSWCLYDVSVSAIQLVSRSSSVSVQFKLSIHWKLRKWLKMVTLRTIIFNGIHTPKKTQTFHAKQQLKKDIVSLDYWIIQYLEGILRYWSSLTSLYLI